MQLARVLAVLHDLNLAAAFADRICLLNQGRIGADGPPAIMLRAERLGPVYAADLEVHTDPATGRPLVLMRPPGQVTLSAA